MKKGMSCLPLCKWHTSLKRKQTRFKNKNPRKHINYNIIITEQILSNCQYFIFVLDACLLKIICISSNNVSLYLELTIPPKKNLWKPCSLLYQLLKCMHSHSHLKLCICSVSFFLQICPCINRFTLKYYFNTYLE